MRSSTGIVDFSASLDFRVSNVAPPATLTGERPSSAVPNLAQTSVGSSNFATQLNHQQALSRGAFLQNNFLSNSSQVRGSSVQRETGSGGDTAENRDQSSVSVFATYHKNARAGSLKAPEFLSSPPETFEESMMMTLPPKLVPTVTNVMFSPEQRRSHKNSAEESGDGN